MILEYNLDSGELAVLGPPPDDYGSDHRRFSILLAEDGGLGVAEAIDLELILWKREASDGTDARWVLDRIVYLGSCGPGTLAPALGFAEGANVVDFYTPHSRLQVPGGEHHGPAPRLNLLRRGGQQGVWEEKSLEWAQVMFDKGCKAINEKDFADAANCFRHALETRVRHYGGLAPECASTFYSYGCALLFKAREATNPSGANLHGKDQKDGNMTGDGDDSDLDLAWKMLNTARVIVAKSPDKTMEKFNILNFLAEISMRREDRDSAIGYYFEALAILEHLVRPDHFRIFQQNVRISLAFELASMVGDAIPYCAKAISVGKSCMHNLINAKEALLSAKGRSGKLTLEDEISYLARMLPRLQKKLEELEQAASTPSDGIDNIMERVVSVTSHEQNVSRAAARTASLTSSQMAGGNNRDMKRANDDKPISDEPSPKRLAADDSPSVNEM